MRRQANAAYGIRDVTSSHEAPMSFSKSRNSDSRRNLAAVVRENAATREHGEAAWMASDVLQRGRNGASSSYDGKGKKITASPLTTR